MKISMIQLRTMIQEEISKINEKSFDLDPDHEGYCTPMTKDTCTPRRKAFAMSAKKGAIHKANLKRGDNPKGKG